MKEASSLFSPVLCISYTGEGKEEEAMNNSYHRDASRKGERASDAAGEKGKHDFSV